jgi:Uma2 family endonuclease
MSISPEELIMQADLLNVRLEIVRGLPVWEASPVFSHQVHVDRIRQTIKHKIDNSCLCLHVADVLFRFPDDSLKRPDIAILCQTPRESEQDKAITILPDAVIEIVSEGYEKKDLELAPSFYLSVGVKDVVIFEPTTKIVYHYRKDSNKRLESPASIELECGCSCVV